VFLFHQDSLWVQGALSQLREHLVSQDTAGGALDQTQLEFGLDEFVVDAALDQFHAQAFGELQVVANLEMSVGVLAVGRAGLRQALGTLTIVKQGGGVVQLGVLAATELAQG